MGEKMSNPAPYQMQRVSDDSWRTTAFRQRVVCQIEEAMRQAGNPIDKTCKEMENHVFMKAQNRESYMSLVARVIMHVKDISNKNKSQAAAGVGGLQGHPMAPGHQNVQDPINALQTLSKQPGVGGNMPQQPQNIGQLGGQPVSHIGQQMGGLQQPHPPPFGSYQQPSMSQQMTPQQMAPQQMAPQQMAPQQMGARPGMQATIQGGRLDSFLLQQQQQQQQQQPPGTSANQVQPTSATQFSGFIPGGVASPQQSATSQVRQAVPQGAVPQQSAPAYQSYGGLVHGGVASPQQATITQVRAAGPQGAVAPQPPQPFQSISALAGQGMLPSPTAITVTSLGPSPSPAALLPSPSPSSTVVPSPVSKQSYTTGAPSPVGSMNTPGNPGSIGQASPAPGSHLMGASEQAYLNKLKQLKKYVEPLKRMIAKIEKDEERKTDLNKMKNLLDILSDSSKRLPMETLRKCEQVLVKLDFHQASQHMCQSLLDTVAEYVERPTINHSLERTFGPAVQALHGAPTRCASPPAKKLMLEEDLDDGISDELQGEIARLGQRFRVNLDPLYHSGSKNVHLICKLDDQNLPSVPPLSVTVPEDYPESSPTCNTEDENYDCTPFLQRIQKTLSSRLLRLPNRFSVTMLLNAWEMSIRKACAPAYVST